MLPGWLKCKDPPAMQETWIGSESGRSPGGGNGNLLQYSCLEKHTDRGAWWATVHGVANTTKQLSMHVIMKEKSESISSLLTADSLQPHELQPTRLLYPWSSPGKNTGVRCHFLLQRIFLTQGMEPRSPTLQADSLPSEHVIVIQSKI